MREIGMIDKPQGEMSECIDCNGGTVGFPGEGEHGHCNQDGRKIRRVAGSWPPLAILRSGEVRIACPENVETECHERHTDFMFVSGGHIGLELRG